MELTSSHFNSSENLSQQRELFKDCFPETDGDIIQSEKHYNWKFHSFPGEIKSYEYASYIGSDMVGYYAAIPYRYKIGNKLVSVGMVCDVMTSSKHRGKGIFTRMGTYSTSELAAHVPFTMGYPIRKEVIPGHLKVGWEIPFSLPLYMKFIRLNALLTPKKIGFIAPLANLALRSYNIFVKTSNNIKYSYTFEDDINLVEGYDNFTKEWSEKVTNALNKDLSFAQWRYSAPERKYKFLTVRSENGKLIAFVAFRKTLKENVPSYGIIDYMVLPGYEDCHGGINKALTSCAKKEGVEAMMIMMSKLSARKYKILKNGYIKSPFSFQLIIKNLTNEFSQEELFNEENWHLMWVDSDDL